MGEELTYSPEQWVEHYQGDYLKTMTIETAGRIRGRAKEYYSGVSKGFYTS